jgi:hypothetical protein
MTALVENGMAKENQMVKSTDVPEGGKRKVGWLGTILWMLGMIVLFNLVAGIVVYLVMSPK